MSDGATSTVAVEPATSGLASHVPGIGALRSYHRSWLRFDLIAGVVLAAILVPQGMAYAELAGLPPVTGLYTTIACLVGYALMGPSRVLVLGPDSSVSPLIFAAIFPLVAVTDDPEKAIALAGMMAILVGLILIGLGLGKLGFVADLLSKEVQVGYMNGLAITIIVGQLPKLFGFSTDADGFIEEVQTFFTGLDERNTTALVVGVGTLAVLLLLPRVTRAIPAVLVAVVGATVVTALFDLDISTVGALPQGLPRPELPWTDVGRRGADARRGSGHHARLTHRHHRDGDRLRGPSGRRGRPQPGDDRHRYGEHRGGGLPGIRRLHQRVANRGRRVDGCQEPAHRPGRSARRRVAAAVLQHVARRPPADGPRRRRDQCGTLARRPQGPAPLPGTCARARSSCRSWPRAASCSSACCRASSSPSSCRSCCSSSGAGGRTARCSATSKGRDGTASE